MRGASTATTANTRAYLKYCEAELLPRAAETMHTALERSAPWSCARAVLAYRVTLVRGDILSLDTEGREEHLPPRLTLRRAETWDRRTGFLLPLTAFFPPKTAVKKRLVRAARETAREQMETGTAAYYSDYGALLRRAGDAPLVSAAVGEISQPPFLLNMTDRVVEKNGKRLKLTQLEYQIMKLFMENPDKALTREEILDTVWGRGYFGEVKIVDVNIRRLRLKIEDDAQEPRYIATVWGTGYKWSTD